MRSQNIFDLYQRLEREVLNSVQVIIKYFNDKILPKFNKYIYLGYETKENMNIIRFYSRALSLFFDKVIVITFDKETRRYKVRIRAPEYILRNIPGKGREGVKIIYVDTFEDAMKIVEYVYKL